MKSRKLFKNTTTKLVNQGGKIYSYHLDTRINDGFTVWHIDRTPTALSPNDPVTRQLWDKSQEERKKIASKHLKQLGGKLVQAKL